MSTEQKVPEIGKSIHAGEILTNYHEMGSGEPVILIHGSGPGVSAWSNWRLALPYLGERFRALAYDQIGFGYSELPTRHVYDLERWTNHLFGFMDALDIERAHRVGNSMGTAVALAAAVTRPERVRRLVLMGAMGVPFPITEGLDAVWGYTPSVANMKHLIDLFAYNRKLVTDELAEQRYQASIRPGASTRGVMPGTAARSPFTDAIVQRIRTPARADCRAGPSADPCRSSTPRGRPDADACHASRATPRS